MIKIYTDGSCIGNPGNGGWAAIIIENGKKTQIKGSKKETTNNQMELLAPIKALKRIPKGSRASDPKSALDKNFINKRNIKIISDLNQIAKKRGQTLSQMALAWVLNNKAVTTALIGASSVKQIKENIESLNNLNFSKSELTEINKKAKEGNINKWARSSSY